MTTLTLQRRATEMLLIAYQLDEIAESLRDARDGLVDLGDCATPLMLMAGDGRGIECAASELTERARFMLREVQE